MYFIRYIQEKSLWVIKSIGGDQETLGTPISHLRPEAASVSDNLSFNHVSPFTALTLDVSAGPRKRSFKELSRQAVCVYVCVSVSLCILMVCLQNPKAAVTDKSVTIRICTLP